MKKCNVIRLMSLVLIGIISTFVGSNVIFAVEYTNVDNANDFQNAIEEGKSIKLVEDIELSSPITVTKENITINLNGKVLSYKTKNLGEAMITNKGSLTITDSTASANGKISFEYFGEPDASYSEGNYTIANNGTLVIENGIVENTTDASEHVSFTIDNRADLTVNGGEVVNNNDFAIRQYVLTKDNSVKINGGTVTGTRSVSIQLGSNTSVKPNVSLDITGGNLIGTGVKTWGGKEYTIAVYSYSEGTSLENVKVNISGGILEGDLAFTNGKNKEISELVNITGGQFTGVNGVYSYYEGPDKARINISGGTFVYDISDYVSDTYVVKFENEKYTVVENTVIETTDKKVSFESDEAFSNEFALVVEEVKEEDVKEVSTEVSEKFKDNKKVKDVKLLALYEINVEKNGKVQPMKDGNFKISVEIEEDLQKYDAYKVVYINDEGEVEETLDAKLVDGKIVFETTHLSTYGIVGYNNVEVKNPSTGDNIVTYILIGLMSLVAFGYVANKLRKTA